MASEASKRPITVYGAIASNLIIAVAKFLVAAFTGSSAMISEGLHSLADTGNQCLLLFGLHRSQQPADQQHPFGHGQELYFWSLIVAIILFGVGGGMSIYEGISHIWHPSELSNPTWNYVVLGIGIVVEGISWLIALRHLLKAKAEDENLWEAIRSSKDPSVFTVLGEDTAAILGLVIAGIGIFLSHQYQNPVFDGGASIVIGIILILVATFLAYESRSLLIGERARKSIVNDISAIIKLQSKVQQTEPPLTMHFGPHDILLNLSISFNEGVTATDITTTIDQLEKDIHDQHPEIKQIFIKADSIKQT